MIPPFARIDLYERAVSGKIIRQLRRRDHQLNDNLVEVAEDLRALRLEALSSACDCRAFFFLLALYFCSGNFKVGMVPSGKPTWRVLS
jgi:hypothetical protein